VFDDRGDEFLAAADSSSECAVGPAVGVVLPGAPNQGVSLLSVAFRKGESLGRATVVLAGLLDIRVR
jgi:hypothetical protein